MIEGHAVLEGLAEMPPGAELAAALASIDRSRLNGHELVTVAEARARLAAHVNAELMADLAEIGHCPPGGPESTAARTEAIQEFAAEEIAFALAWTRRAAQDRLALALDVVDRLPQIYAAMRAGDLDLPRSRVIADAVAPLGDSAAAAVVEEILPFADRLTTGALRARLQRLVLSVDPTAAARRQQQVVAERRVVCEQEADGTGSITALGLPPERAAAAKERIDALARAAKVAGDRRTLDQLRADVFLDLLAGTHRGPTPVGRRGVVELTIPLTTLAELSEQPGHIAGFGPVIADVARQVAERQRDGEWRYSVVEPGTGRVIHTGTTRRRPTKPTATHVIARDRTCRAPGCRAPASRADLDHTVDYAHGGRTTARNLGALCRHHHRAKHQGGYRLRQYLPGHFHWITPLGHQYLKAPDPAEDPPTMINRDLARRARHAAPG